MGGDREASAIADELLRITDPKNIASHSPAELQSAWEALSQKRQSDGLFPPVNGHRNHSSRHAGLPSSGSAASSRYEARREIQSCASERRSPQSDRSRDEQRPPVAALRPLAERESLRPQKQTPTRRPERNRETLTDDCTPKRLSASSDDEDGVALAPTEEQGLTMRNSQTSSGSYGEDSFEMDEDTAAARRGAAAREAPQVSKPRPVRRPAERCAQQPLARPLRQPPQKLKKRKRSTSRRARQPNRTSDRKTKTTTTTTTTAPKTTITALPPVRSSQASVPTGPQRSQRKAQVVCGRGSGRHLPQVTRPRGGHPKSEASPTPGGEWDVEAPHSLRGDARQAFGRVLRMAEEADKAAAAALSPPDRRKARGRPDAPRPRQQRKRREQPKQGARRRSGVRAHVLRKPKQQQQQQQQQQQGERSRRMQARLQRLRREKFGGKLRRRSQSSLAGRHSSVAQQSPPGPRPFYAYSEDQRRRQEARNKARAKLGLGPLLPGKPRRKKAKRFPEEAAPQEKAIGGIPRRWGSEAEANTVARARITDTGDTREKANGLGDIYGGKQDGDSDIDDSGREDSQRFFSEYRPRACDELSSHVPPEPPVKVHGEVPKRRHDSLALSSSSSEGEDGTDAPPRRAEVGNTAAAATTHAETSAEAEQEVGRPSASAEAEQEVSRPSAASAESSYEEDFEELDHDATAGKPCLPEPNVPESVEETEPSVPPLGVGESGLSRQSAPPERDSTARSSEMGDWF